MQLVTQFRSSAYRRGVTLLEIVLVGTGAAVLCGLLAMYARRDVLQEVGAAGDARCLALDLYQLRQRSAREGCKYTLEFAPAAAPTQYTIFRHRSSGWVVETIRRIPPELQVVPSCAVLHCSQQGFSGAPVAIHFSNGSRQQTVSISETDGTVGLR